ncbi:MAG: 1-acyl-sn-glycerol-3-phosphate acyltransferase [Nocardioides sp.]|nr:1-acyl-sn-glycerol-3-phosphate acyltransferase [Nocardioides sp.]
MRDVTYPPIIWTALTGFKALGQTFQLSGTEHVPRTGGVLLAYNHISYVDFIYGGLAARPSRRLVRFMAKRELFDHRAVGPLMRSLHHIEVDRASGEKSLDTALAHLRAGEAVGIFPEATISRAMDLKEIKTGAVRIAAEAGVPLVPVILWGTQRMMTKDHPRDFSRGKTIAVTVGEAMHPDGSDPIGDTALLKSRMTAMLDATVAAYPVAEQPPGSWWVPERLGGAAPRPARAAELDMAEKRERAAQRSAKRASRKN